MVLNQRSFAPQVLRPPRGIPYSYFFLFGNGPMGKGFLRHLMQHYSRTSGNLYGVVSVLIRPPQKSLVSSDPILLVSPTADGKFTGEELRGLDYSFHSYRELGSAKRLINKMEPHIFMCLSFDAYCAVISATGHTLNIDNADVQHDLHMTPDQAPKTVYGATMRLIEDHFADSSEKLIFHFCENNHDSPRKLFEQFMAACTWKSDQLADHFEHDVEMVACMMDRVVPTLTEAKAEQFRRLFQWEGPVVFTEQFGLLVIPETTAPSVPWHELQGTSGNLVRFVQEGERAKWQFLKRYFAITHQIAGLTAGKLGASGVHQYVDFTLAHQLIDLTYRELARKWPPIDPAYVEKIPNRIQNDMGDEPIRVLRDMGSRKIPIILQMIAAYFEDYNQLPHSLVLIVAEWLANLDQPFLSQDKAATSLLTVHQRLQAWAASNDVDELRAIFASISDATGVQVYRNLHLNWVFMQSLAQILKTLSRNEDGFELAHLQTLAAGDLQLRNIGNSNQ